MAKPTKNRIGNKHYFLTVIENDGYIFNANRRRETVKVKCKCGKIYSITYDNFTRAKSCGCYILRKKKPFNAKCKFTQKDARTIRNLYNSGLYSTIDLKKMFKCAHATITSILNNIRYIDQSYKKKYRYIDVHRNIILTVSDTPRPELRKLSRERQLPSLSPPASDSRQLEFDWQESCSRREEDKS
jgi:hypothetical protein